MVALASIHSSIADLLEEVPIAPTDLLADQRLDHQVSTATIYLASADVKPRARVDARVYGTCSGGQPTALTRLCEADVACSSAREATAQLWGHVGRAVRGPWTFTKKKRAMAETKKYAWPELEVSAPGFMTGSYLLAQG